MILKIKENKIDAMVWIWVLLSFTTIIFVVFLNYSEEYSRFLINITMGIAITLLLFLLAFLLYLFYEGRYWKMIILLEVLTGILTSILGFYCSFLMINLLLESKIFAQFIKDHFTLILILSAFTFNCVFLLFIKTYGGKIIYEFVRTNFNSSIEYINVKNIIMLQSASQFTKVYSIGMVLVTIIWMNTDVPSYLNSFEKLIEKPVLVITLAMSIYGNYLIHILLLENKEDINKIQII